MLERVLDLTEGPARLRVRNEQLVIERDEEQETVTVPLSELAVLALTSARVTCSQSVLAGIMAHGGVVVVCDGRSHPAGMMTPLNAHSTQAKRMAAQAGASRPTNKRLWKAIVQAKVRSQARLLRAEYGDDAGLGKMVSRVRSGDPDNVEAQAAQRYWPLLFNDGDFRRRRDADDQNRLLNYGYAVLRAVVARAICAAGLHPSIGIHHHNQYNAFCLADDLMEPYRPVVDGAVLRLVRAWGKDAPLDKEGKRMLIEPILGRFQCEGEWRTLFDLAMSTASSLARVYMGEESRLSFAEAGNAAG